MKQTIRGIRGNMKLSAKEFADKLDTTENVIYNIENGKTIPDAIFIDKVLNLTGLKYEEIIFLPDDGDLTAKE